MKNKGFLLLILLAAVFFSACGTAGNEETAEEPSGAVIYYVSDSGQGLLKAPCSTERAGEEAIRDLFNTLKGGEFSDGHSAVPEGLELDHTAWQENSLVLYLTGDYPAMGTPEETFCRAAVTLSLLTVSDVDSVIINVNNQPLTDIYGQEIGAMSRSLFMMDLMENSAESRPVTFTLYFASAGGTGLVAETIGTEIRSDQQPEAVVLEMLQKGPLEKNHIATIPAGTGVLGVSIRDRICYVNLNEAFRSAESQVSDRLEIYSIVNSLTALQTVDKVQLTINGSTDAVFDEGLSIGAPLEADLSLVEEQP